MNWLFATRFLSFLLLLFEINDFCIAVSGDEVRVPYVPYVVVDKHKDEFDYDRLQGEIIEYLKGRSAETSTTLYDFLRTSISPAAAPTVSPPAAVHVADVRSIDLRSAHYPPSYPSYPAYPASIYKSVTKRNPLVTGMFKVTTYQPHKYTTPISALKRSSDSDTVLDNVGQASSNSKSVNKLPFFPVKDSGFTPMVGKTTTESSHYMASSLDFKSTSQFPHGSEMKCSLRSSRHVYDGECVSRKPVVETVCADRCIRYEYKKTKKPFYLENTKTESLLGGDMKRQVVALSCSDGDVRKQKVKLYCKDGTVINNIIRIVQNCLCSEHEEKVHATKRNPKQPHDIRGYTKYGMHYPRIGPRPKY